MKLPKPPQAYGGHLFCVNDKFRVEYKIEGELEGWRDVGSREKSS